MWNVYYMRIFFLIGLGYTFIPSSNSVRILGAFPFPSWSHQIVFRSLIDELARRGHEIVMITPQPTENVSKIPDNFKEIDVKNISYSVWNSIIPSIVEEPINVIDQVSMLRLSNYIAELQIQSPDVQRLLNNKAENFDVIFFESSVRTILGVTLPYHDVTVIEISSMGGLLDIFDSMGASDHPILHPTLTRRRIFNLSIYETISELYYYFTCVYQNNQREEEDNNRLRSLFGVQDLSIKQLRTKIQKLFVNVNPLWDSNRPVSQNVLYLGSLQEKPITSLPKDLKKYLDASINGVIYVSFGTNFATTSFSNKTVEMFTRVFSRLPFDFLIKWSSDDFPRKLPNVKVFKWLPQPDLLRHPNIKLFITQGGLQSTDDAISAGVPLIGIPLFVDQWQNVERYEYFGIGIYLSIKTLTETKFVNAITTAVTNKSYRENVKRLHRIMRDQPQSSLDRAVLWTEYVVRTGISSLLSAPASNLSWTEYYEVELVVYVLGIFFLLIYITVYIIKKIVVNIMSKSKFITKPFHEYSIKYTVCSKVE